MFCLFLAAHREHKECAADLGKISNALELVANVEVLKFGKVEYLRSILDQVVRDVARKMVQAALENEVNDFLQMHSTRVDGSGLHMVLRNGYLPSR